MLYAKLASQAMWACELGGVIDSDKRILSWQWHSSLDAERASGTGTLYGARTRVRIIALCHNATLTLCNFTPVCRTNYVIATLRGYLQYSATLPHCTFATIQLERVQKPVYLELGTIAPMHHNNFATLPHINDIKIYRKVALQQRNLLPSPHYN